MEIPPPACYPRSMVLRLILFGLFSLLANALLLMISCTVISLDEKYHLATWIPFLLASFEKMHQHVPSQSYLPDDKAPMGLTEQEINNLIIIERVTASVSVVGTLSLLATFVFIKDFRTLSNTIIFWASFANIFSNVAALIGGSALTKESSPLCQLQGFLLEM